MAFSFQPSERAPFRATSHSSISWHGEDRRFVSKVPCEGDAKKASPREGTPLCGIPFGDPTVQGKGKGRFGRHRTVPSLGTAKIVDSNSVRISFTGGKTAIEDHDF